ncbi:MAG: hypothetical protein HFG66_10700 [Hungatella sp.]|nr:hypothetical protein [Hungatella sp.]MCI8892990.1 hypothetical protein [Eubacterium sp.]
MSSIKNNVRSIWQSTGVTAVKMWLMMTAILIYLLYADFSTAPVYIYSQF